MRKKVILTVTTLALSSAGLFGFANTPHEDDKKKKECCETSCCEEESCESEKECNPTTCDILIK